MSSLDHFFSLFARAGAALKMQVEDVYIQGRRTWVRLHEKGGKRHDMPCHHNLDTYLHAYINDAQLAARQCAAYRNFIYNDASDDPSDCS